MTSLKTQNQKRAQVGLGTLLDRNLLSVKTRILTWTTQFMPKLKASLSPLLPCLLIKSLRKL